MGDFTAREGKVTTFRWLLSAAVLTLAWFPAGCRKWTDTTARSVPAAVPAAVGSQAAEPPKSAESPSPAASPPAAESGSSSPMGVPRTNSSSTSTDDPSAHSFEIRDSDGRPIVTDRQIVSYDWKTHRITLKPGMKVEPPAKEGQYIVSGIPFAIAADGVVCYAGVFTTSFSSISQSVPVINLHPLEKEEDILRIELGYPSEQFFRGVDPRDDRRIRAAWTALGKLKE